MLCCRANLLIISPSSAGTNPVQLTRGMDKTVAALVKELAKLSTEVASDKDLANVASVSAGAQVTAL
jgi:chaperonin GroEL (HSP60 family)